MQVDSLYRIQKKDFQKLKELLTECFSSDPLYEKLIPDASVRKRLLPELFDCDLAEFFHGCNFFADSADINGMLIVCDTAETINNLRYHLDELFSAIRTDFYLIKEDTSLNTLIHFIKGKDYLNSKWTRALPKAERLHIIYLAVRPSMQHHGISGHMLNEMIRYAADRSLMISLETHNEANLALYHHHGFETYDVVSTHYDLTQYCLIHRPETPITEA